MDMSPEAERASSFLRRASHSIRTWRGRADGIFRVRYSRNRSSRRRHRAAHERSPRRLRLLYSNRRPEDAAFLGELQELERRSETFRLVATMTQAGDLRVPWDGRNGRIDAGLISEVATGLPRPVYYVAGPPGLVESVCDLLGEAGVGDDDIRSEDFFGY